MRRHKPLSASIG